MRHLGSHHRVVWNLGELGNKVVERQWQGTLTVVFSYGSYT